MMELPRSDYVSGAIVQITPIRHPAPFMGNAESGRISTRPSGRRGVSWREEYGLLHMRYPETNAFLSFVRNAYSRGLPFLATHPLLPGSGQPHLGAASGTITVAGSNQSGDSIILGGFPPSTEAVFRAGTAIQFAGTPFLYEVNRTVNSNSSGTAVVRITPGIRPDYAPESNEEVAYNGIKIRVVLDDDPIPPNTSNSLYWSGLTISMSEVYNAPQS